MARIHTSSGIDMIQGKMNGRDTGYFYMRNGKQFYRTREETYQQNQSPRQKYNSEVFAYANAYMAQHYGTPEGKIRLETEFEAANHIGSNGKTYTIRQALRYRKNPREYANATFVFNVTLTDRNSVTLRSIDYSNPDTNGIEDMSGGLNVEGGGSKVEGYPVYDPQGRRLKAPQKGINIVSGRKLIVK